MPSQVTLIWKVMNKQPRIPTPAHPHKRREALPWQQPKTTEEDPEALQRVQAILNSPSYRRAENDSDFLAQDDVRGVRLQIDYLKPELLLEEHEIHQTIVVFGSTRICEPATARRKAEALRASLAGDPSKWNLSVGWQLLSDSMPKVIITRWPVNSAVLWAVRIMGLANTIRSS